MIGSFTRPRFIGGAVAILALILLAFGSHAPPASASLLAPGTSGPPDVFIISPTATLLASIAGPLNSASFTATYIDAVYRDPGNVFGANDLDFVIQVKDTGASPRSRVISNTSPTPRTRAS